jgi:hypothetical protein
MVETGAVQQHDGRLRLVELPPAGGDEGIVLLRITAWLKPSAKHGVPGRVVDDVGGGLDADRQPQTSLSPIPAALSCSALIC